MKSAKNESTGKSRWFLIIYIIAMVVLMTAVVVGLFTDFFGTSEEGGIPSFAWLGAGLVLLVAILSLLAKTYKIFDAIEQNGTKFERLIGAVEKNRAVLTQISKNTRLSETAKAIAFRDADQQSLRSAVFDKLQQQDFDTAYEIIEEIAHSTIYTELSNKLRTEADNYRDASDQDRITQVIAHIEKLIENHQWTKASTHIERLIKAQPKSEKAKAMRQLLIDNKNDRKKILLNAWDDAVRRQATDRSLEILRELDSYLTPNEGLALQEAARDVFRNKLHSLGVQFSLAISGRRWERAFETAQEIVRDFPNSKMAEEIREKMDVLKQRVS